MAARDDAQAGIASKDGTASARAAVAAREPVVADVQDDERRCIVRDVSANHNTTHGIGETRAVISAWSRLPGLRHPQA
jgi:hypothetical protein